MKQATTRLSMTRWICGSLLALLLALPAVAAPVSEIAFVENRGTKLVFYTDPELEADHVNLTVTGPCNYEYREVIERGGIGVFTLSEETIDGIYRYDLVAIEKVSGEVLEVLKEARLANDNTQVDKLCRLGELPGSPLNQFGGVRVSQGLILWDPEKVEDRFTENPDKMTGDDNLVGFQFKDQVINDDLIVDGSACIGFDCVNGEVFGFDTLRLKENNLRIHFDDTSVAASFPRNDWTLVANDSANGGASKFSIEDRSNSRTPFTVEANARSHSLYVDDGGRIGSRTSTPSTEIHTIDGDTPTLRLQQDGSSGFAPQTWDVAGNETNFFIRDVTNGSTLPFRIRPGAPSSAIFIDVDGDVGLGTSSPSGPFHIVQGNANFLVDAGTNNADVVSLTSSTDNEPLFRIFETAAGGTLMSMFDSGGAEDFRLATTGGEQWASGNFGLNCSTPNSNDFTIHDGTNAAGTSCDAGTFSFINAGDASVTASSSRSIKENLVQVPAEGILEKIAGIDVYNYDFIVGQKNKLGLMAEDFHQVFGRGSDKLLNGQEVQMALWLAVKELSAQNQALASQLAEVQAQLAAETGE